MPVQIQMAQPADLAGEYLRGVQTSAQISQARQRLDQQAMESQMRMQAEQKRLQQEHAVQQQRIAVTQAYQQQQLGLKKQQLDQIKAVNDQKTRAAARQFEARQQWEQGFSKIDSDPNLSEEEKDKAKTSFTMRLAPMMGIPGTEAASMLRDMRPQKPVVPASVDTTSNPDFAIVHQPNGSVVMHPKPRAASAGADNVKVQLQPDTPPVTMSRKQAMATIPSLDPELQTNAVNKAVMAVNVARGTSDGNQSFESPDAVKAAYKSGKLTRPQAVKILQEQFGHE